MRQKNVVVIQRAGGVGCKKLINPPEIEKYKGAKNALINPDMERVQKIPLEFWELDIKNNRVLPSGSVARSLTRATLALEVPVLKTQQKLDAIVIGKKLLDAVLLLILLSLVLYGLNNHETIREFLNG